MSMSAPATAKPGTWIDWMAPGTPEPTELITRDEVIDRLLQRGVKIAARTLAHWESIGATPRPVRRWRDGAPRALYPDWVVDIAVQVPHFLRYEGLTLSEIGDTLRGQLWPPDAVVLLPDGSRFGGTVYGGYPRILGNLTDAALVSLADRYHRATGVPIRRIDIHVVDERGTGVETRYPPARQNTPE